MPLADKNYPVQILSISGMRLADGRLCMSSFNHCSWRPGKEKTPPDGEAFWVKPLAVTYSCMAKPHYHRRMRVSLLSSGWDQVVPRRYGRQGRGGSSAGAPAPHLLEKVDRCNRSTSSVRGLSRDKS